MPSSTGFESEVSAIIEVLNRAHDEIKAIDRPEIAQLQGKILGELKRNINSLSLQLGREVDEIDNKVDMTKPLRKVLGRELTPPDSKKKEDGTEKKPLVRKTADEVELDELRARVEELYPKFLGTPSDDLLDSVSDIEIRGVAKKAGLPVTETNPKRITTKYIDQVKESIQKQITIQKQGETGSNDNGNKD